MRYIEALRKALEEILEEDKDVFLIGEDITDPYGGAFKVTKGLSSKFPDRLIPTPMSEAGFSLAAVGMALAGLKPIVEIMFGDFMTLASDALINHATVLNFITEKKLHLVFRAPMGGYRGYGATHSKCMENMFLSFPGIKVVAPSFASDVGKLLKLAVGCGKPVLFEEFKLDYGRTLLPYRQDAEMWIVDETETYFPSYFIRPKDTTHLSALIITYGELVYQAYEVAKKLLGESIKVGILSVSCLNCQDTLGILPSVAKEVANILVLSEGYEMFGWAPYIAHILREHLPTGHRIRTMGAKHHILGVSPTLENYVLPTAEDIEKSIREMVGSGN